MQALRLFAFVLAFAATWAPMAHVLELPNKLRLGGAAWLAIQQSLYNGWGPFIGAPTELGGLLLTLWLAFLCRMRGRLALPYVIAALAFVAMLASYFLLNAPVNRHVVQWTAETLPANWPLYRQQWEAGHVLAAAAALVALIVTGRAWYAAGQR